MSERPRLDRTLDGKTFRSYYYLKEELGKRAACLRRQDRDYGENRLFPRYGRCAPGFCKDKEQAGCGSDQRGQEDRT